MYKSSIVLAHRNEKFSSELLQGKKFTYFGFEVLLNNVVLRRNTEYYVEAKITGPDSTRGDNGDSIVTCSGVTFTFKTFSWPGNNTTVQRGQFPELMFSL